MYTETSVWQTPVLPKQFDWEAEGVMLEDLIIAPAIKHIVANTVSARLAAINPIANGAIGLLSQAMPKEGWDSSVRFNQRMERVLPFKENGASTNPAFQEPGLVVFSRNDPKGGYLVDVARRAASYDTGQAVNAWITVTIPDESVFETEWFRLA